MKAAKHPKKILMFDFDGVVADNFEFVYRCNKAVHFPRLTRKAMREAFTGNFYEAAGKWYSPHKAPDFCKLYAAYAPKMKFYPGIITAIKKLSSKYTLAVISSNSGKAIEELLARRGTRRYFKDIMGLEFSKSKTEKIRFLLHKYKAAPKDCLFITDTLGDILEARKCGVKALALTGGYHSKKTLLKGSPAIIISQRAQIPRAVGMYLGQK